LFICQARKSPDNMIATPLDFRLQRLYLPGHSTCGAIIPVLEGSPRDRPVLGPAEA